MQQYVIKNLGITHYVNTWENMQTFTNARDHNSADEFWVLQHHDIFTLGLSGKIEHLLDTSHDIPVVRCDRGGQVTYHGLGQIVIYTMIDIKRLNLSIRCLVEKLEQGIINYLAELGIKSHSSRQAPGVYVGRYKIGSLGLKVRRGCTYHGISFNFNMDLKPFNYINVCGYSGLKVTQVRDFIREPGSIEEAGQRLAYHLTQSVYHKIICNK